MPRVQLLLLSLLLTACGETEPPSATAGLTGAPFSVEAAPDTAYTLRCRFRATRIPGVGVANSLDLSGKGPQQGNLPGQDARCQLGHAGGAGPVTLTIVKDGPKRATVAAPGEDTNLVVF
jgi:hypothetical protein